MYSFELLLSKLMIRLSFNLALNLLRVWLIGSTLEIEFAKLCYDLAVFSFGRSSRFLLIGVFLMKLNIVVSFYEDRVFILERMVGGFEICFSWIYLKEFWVHINFVSLVIFGVTSNQKRLLIRASRRFRLFPFPRYTLTLAKLLPLSANLRLVVAMPFE